jgi:hypothetical protein
MRANEFLAENKQATAQQVLGYVNKTHHEPLTAKLSKAVLVHPRWELTQIPLSQLHIPEEEYDDEDQTPKTDPYDRIMAVDAEHANEYSTQVIDQHPIVVDDQGYIIDGNHRAWAAAELLNRDSIPAWIPVNQSMTENFADGKVKGKSRPGRVKRSGASCNGSVTDLRARAKRASGEKAKMYHWCANMKSGRKKK